MAASRLRLIETAILDIVGVHTIPSIDWFSITLPFKTRYGSKRGLMETNVCFTNKGGLNICNRITFSAKPCFEFQGKIKTTVQLTSVYTSSVQHLQPVKIRKLVNLDRLLFWPGMSQKLFLNVIISLVSGHF